MTGARKRDLEVTISQDFYESKVKEACAYCGRKPAHGKRHGIDRVDNAVGYVPDNCVTACGDCNLAKWKNTAEDYVAKCKVIASRAEGIIAAVPDDVTRCVHMRAKRKSARIATPAKRKASELQG